MNNAIQDESVISILPSWFKNVLLLWEAISNTKDVLLFSISFLLILILTIYIITRWQQQINKKSQQKINKLKSIGKYIDSIFVELNSSKELLRYFLHGKKWKKKIVNSYNALFKTYTGKLAKKYICTDVKFFIPSYTRSNIIKKHIEKMQLLIKTMKEHGNIKINKEDTGDFFYYVESTFFRYDDLLKSINEKIIMYNTNYVLAIGSAGNGKTNLLCNFSETVIKYGQPCIFIDAKEIKENIEAFLFEEFNIPWIFNLKINFELFLTIYSLLLRLKNKYIFVIIDALNENDSDGFHDSIINLLNILNKYKRIKILASCRSEYFNERFKKVFEKINSHFTIIPINEIKYNLRAKEKALSNYQRYFNVKGVIIGSAKDKLFSSLLLMRIFFEVNRDKEVNALELRNAEIYKQYIKQTIEKFSEINPNTNFQEIIDKIIKFMLENNTYDGFPISKLGNSNIDINKMKPMLDENMIINKKIKIGSGITEMEKEIIYFVFDELRDYCISRNILIDCEQQDKIDYIILFEFLERLNKYKLSPLEGVLKYSYYYLKNESKNPDHLEFCKILLDKYGEVIEYDFYDKQNCIFHNFGILMIMADSTNLEEFELEYIVKSIKLISDLWNMLNLLLSNEIAGCGLTVQIFIRILLYYTPNGIRKIITDMTDERKHYTISESNGMDKFISNILCQNRISNETKWILLIMNEIQRNNKKIEKCISNFNIGEEEKERFITWLSDRKYPHSYINDISKLISFKEKII